MISIFQKGEGKERIYDEKGSVSGSSGFYHLFASWTLPRHASSNPFFFHSMPLSEG